MSQPLRGRGASNRRPTSNQSRLSFASSSQATPPIESSQEPTSPTISSALSLLDSVQFEGLEQDTPNTTRSSTPSISTKTKKKRTCWVYNYMAGTEDMQTVFYNKDGVEVWPCGPCAKQGKIKEYIVSAGSRNIETHLKNAHSIHEDSPMNKRL
jgi:hypothetical protein